MGESGAGHDLRLNPGDLRANDRNGGAPRRCSWSRGSSQQEESKTTSPRRQLDGKARGPGGYVAVIRIVDIVDLKL
ncbi:MAG: hypothetical protein AVDCRST_MAG59-972 [uncultured Thermomicrobiales bacterium]|uniref:Uncharacterized protein n=1 Tax=uncultured Thermomicrobiales bacterium TaxID=1645740 RepID=A0A6J4UAN3_9BACT|nr:MAG: hypothetical protein AVDCRST_MAG59-972 [uncultured Thermomicrobiales bacterium]